MHTEHLPTGAFADQPVGRVGGGMAPPTPAATLRRTVPRPGRGQVKSYGDDRVCAASGCATRLSRYNATSHCVVHQLSPQ